RRRGAGVSWQLSLKEHTRPGTRGTNDDILTKRIDDRQRRVIFRCEWPGRDYAYLVTRRIPLAPEAFHAQRVAWCCGSVAESSGWSGVGLRQETDKAEHSHHPVRRPWLRRLSLLRSSVDSHAEPRQAGVAGHAADIVLLGVAGVLAVARGPAHRPQPDAQRRL